MTTHFHFDLSEVTFELAAISFDEKSSHTSIKSRRHKQGIKIANLLSVKVQLNLCVYTSYVNCQVFQIIALRFQ